MNNDEQEFAISYFIEEVERNESNLNIEEFMDKINNTELNEEINYEFKECLIINYNENYTVKELLLICEYYGFAKEMKINKFNKEQIIEFLISFEMDSKNNDIVSKRQNLWFYINELKNDKFMKKFIFW